MNPEAAQNLLNDTFKRYVTPERERRQRVGITGDAEVWAFQVVFQANQEAPRVRLNREVRLLAVAAGSTQKTDYIELRDSGCQALSSVELIPEESNIRHISWWTITTIAWQGSFDLHPDGARLKSASGQVDYQCPSPTSWQTLYSEHDRVLELVLAINSPSPQIPIETVMAVALQRSRHLIEAYVPLLQSKNLTAASALIRMQLDSAMRVNACFLVANPLVIWDALKADTSWRHIASADGSKLTDAYLHKQLSEKFSWATALYKQMSGYIHLSRPHLESAVEGEEFLGMVIYQGPAGVGLTEEELAKNAEQFIRVTEALLSLCEGYARTRNG